MCQAAVQEHSIIGTEESDIANCKVIFDGTWRKLCHTTHTMQGEVIELALKRYTSSLSDLLTF